MKSRILHIAQYVATLLIGLALLIWVLQNISVQMVLEQLGEANMGWIFASMGLSLASCWFRALRWQLQLEVRGADTSSSSIFTALMVGYFANQLLPRTGELVRCSVLPQQSSPSFPVTFGTVIAERMIDLLVLLVLVLAVLMLEYELIISYLSHTALAGIDMGSLGGLFILFIGLAATGLFVRFLLRQKHWKWIMGVRTFAAKLWDGIISIFQLRSPFLFMLYTMLIWICYWGMTYVVFLAFPPAGSTGGSELLYVAGVLMIMGTIGMSVPIPGGIGAYHAAVIFTYGAMNVDALLGGGLSGELFAITAHGARMVMLLLVGAGAAVVLWINSSDRIKKTILEYKDRKHMIYSKKTHPKRL